MAGRITTLHLQGLEGGPSILPKRGPGVALGATKEGPRGATKGATKGATRGATKGATKGVTKVDTKGVLKRTFIVCGNAMTKSTEHWFFVHCCTVRCALGELCTALDLQYSAQKDYGAIHELRHSPRRGGGQR